MNAMAPRPRPVDATARWLFENPGAEVDIDLAAARLTLPNGAATTFPIEAFMTSGDRIQGRLQDQGGKGLFTKELDEALLDGRIDAAVHSMKDLPTRMPPGIVLAAVPAREDPREFEQQSRGGTAIARAHESAGEQLGIEVAGQGDRSAAFARKLRGLLLCAGENRFS